MGDTAMSVVLHPAGQKSAIENEAEGIWMLGDGWMAIRTVDIRSHQAHHLPKLATELEACDSRRQATELN